MIVYDLKQFIAVQLLQKMEKATPAAYRTLSALLEDYRTRVAAVQSEEAREYLLEVCIDSPSQVIEKGEPRIVIASNSACPHLNSHFIVSCNRAETQLT